MPLKLFLLLFLFLSTLVSQEYPSTYKQLGTPLFSSVKPFLELQENPLLHQDIERFKQEAKTVLESGLRADKSSSQAKMSYLKKLRGVQKSYDRVLFKLHQAIAASIEAKDYEEFVRLTRYPFEGLLQNSALKEKAVAFYAQNRTKCKCKVLESEIEDAKLLNETEKYFEEVVAQNSTFSSNAQQNTHKKVRIETSRVKNSISVNLVNENLYPVTIEVNTYYENLEATQGTQKELVLQAKSVVHYTDLSIKGRQAYYKYSLSWMMGSKNAKHNTNYIYRLPYKLGTSHIVSQGYNGKATHKGRSAYSIDFPMPEGTKIYAAREGVVVKTKSNSHLGGYDKKYASSGNYVRILHNDGTLATYYHLKYRGVLVRVGQKVLRGEALGYSGNTGYTSGPHLHFSVFQAISASKTQTIPVKIMTAEGVLTEPVIGHSYEAK